jgi:hypothetical protein
MSEPRSGAPSETGRPAVPGNVLEGHGGEHRPPSRWVADASEVLGLAAGAVAVVYMLGGLAFALRLLLDGSSVSETTALVGQLPRDFLITAGFVLVLGPPAVVAVTAGLVLAAFDGVSEPPPKHARGPSGRKWPGLSWRWGFLPTWIWLGAVAVISIVPALVLLLQEEVRNAGEVSSLVFAWLISWLALGVGWYSLRQVAERHRDHRRRRSLLGGLIWLAMAVPASLAAAAHIGLEPARVCLHESGEVRGRLVADTRDAVFLTRTSGTEEEEAVVRVPAGEVRRLTYGDAYGDLPNCATTRWPESD